jgi:tetratricopeptide (TPR) repeat protein
MADGAQEVLSGMTVKNLRALANEHRIDLGGVSRKAEIVEVMASHPGIEAVLGLVPPEEEPPPPPPGWEPPPPPGEADEGLFPEETVGEEPVEEPTAEEADIREALASMTVKELKKLAADQGIALKGRRKKADIVEAIAAHPRAADVIREEVQREQEEIEVLEGALDEVGEAVEEAIEGVVELPPMDVPGADEEISEGLNIDVDFGNAEDLLDQARMRFEESNYDRAAGLAEEALAIADLSMVKFQRLAMAYTLMASQRLIEDSGRSGHDVEDAASRLVEAKKRFSDGSLMDDLTVIRALQEATRSLYSKDIHEARETIYEAQDLVADAEGLGADVSSAREFLRMGRIALDRTDHADALQMAAKAKEAAEEARLRRIEEIQEAIPVTQGMIQEARNVGADVSESERLIKQAEIALEAKDFVLVSELVKRAERSAMESQHYQIEKAMELRRRQVEKTHAIIESLEPTVIQARRLGIDVSEAEALLAKAREVLQDGDYVNGTMYAKEAYELVKRIEPRLEEAELSAGIAKPSAGVCRECHSRDLVFYDNGGGKCLDCNRTFQWRKEMEKTFWEKFKDLLKE